MTAKRKRHLKHNKRRHVPRMRAKRHGTGMRCRNTLESDTAQAKPIVADGRKACQGKPRDTRLSRPCPQVSGLGMVMACVMTVLSASDGDV